jgi:hypothetical protein
MAVKQYRAKKITIIKSERFEEEVLIETTEGHEFRFIIPKPRKS